MPKRVKRQVRKEIARPRSGQGSKQGRIRLEHLHRPIFNQHAHKAISKGLEKMRHGMELLAEAFRHLT